MKKQKSHKISFTREQIEIIHIALHAYRNISESLHLSGLSGFDKTMRDKVEECRKKVATIVFEN